MGAQGRWFGMKSGGHKLFHCSGGIFSLPFSFGAPNKLNDKLPNIQRSASFCNKDNLHSVLFRINAKQTSQLELARQLDAAGSRRLAHSAQQSVYCAQFARHHCTSRATSTCLATLVFSSLSTVSSFQSQRGTLQIVSTSLK